MTVDKSLSKGLADRVIAEFEDIANRHVKACSRFAFAIPRKRHDVNRIATELCRIGERSGLSQVLGHHPKWRWAIVAAFLPLPGHFEKAHDSNRTICYYLFPIHLHVEKRGLMPTSPVPILEIREHAFERMFQRLNSMDPEAVKDEIHEALCLSPHLLAASRSLGLRQAILPTKSGAFLCGLDPSARAIQANTWIPYQGNECRKEQAAVAIAHSHASLGGPRLLAETIAALPYGSTLYQVETLPEIESVLRQFPWLRDPHEPRIDHEAEIWKMARTLADIHGPHQSQLAA